MSHKKSGKGPRAGEKAKTRQKKAKAKETELKNEAAAPEVHEPRVQQSVEAKHNHLNRSHIMNAEVINHSINQAEKVTQNLMQACEEANTTAREHVDAAMRSAAVAWEGCLEINQKATGMLQESLARSMNIGKTLTGIKSPQEAADIHAGYIRESFDSWMAGAGRITEILARVTKESFDPIAEQANNTMGKIAQKSKAVAA